MLKVTKSVRDLLSQYVVGLQKIVVMDDYECLVVEELLSLQSNISEYLYFHFYETLKYYLLDPFPSYVEDFGKWLRPSNNISSDL